MADELTLEQIVQREVEWYKSELVIGAKSYIFSDIPRRSYAVIDVPDDPKFRPAFAVVMARVIDDYVVILEDNTDRPLVRSLVSAGIPREKIFLEYAGEKLHDTTASP